ncbi:EAL domain-containing protein [Enterobacter ludwigii]|uniref:EAL domain-containing protein n=1 Tax=Enterobacter ludwigii TaxID=299767 RepID=UPI003D1FF639
MLIKPLNRIARTRDRNVNRTMAEDYVISICPYAAKGLVTILTKRSRICRVINPLNKEDYTDELPFTVMRHSRIVVYFSDNLVEILATLKILALFCRLSQQPLRAFIISSCRADWLYRTLSCLTNRNRGSLVALRLVPAGITVQALLSLFENWNNAVLLTEQAHSIENLTGIRPKGLSSRELETILRSLLGENMIQQSRQLGLSYKTLYTQHIAGIRKLLGEFPHLAHRQKKCFRSGAFLTLATTEMKFTPLELDFEQAIHKGDVFVVFQPITDAHFQVQGFEILIRWLRNGREYQAGEFLPQINSYYSWLLLTAFVINEAVTQINRTSGTWYFSVNIPRCVAESTAMLKMVTIARRQLRNPRHARRLVFEFSETIDVTQGEAMKNALHLLHSEHPVMLDDCFSSGSVLFPVRQLQFSGYKLDMSIVNNFMHNSHDDVLIKMLANYCRQTDRMCIAEGVDSPEKFDALAKAGVTSFQGYYISCPISRANLDKTVALLDLRHLRGKDAPTI